jgi:hypothetical protein
MNHWLENTRQQFQKGETLIANSVGALFRGWQHPAIVIDKLFEGDRWQSAIRRIQQVPTNLAEVLRERTCND